MVNLNELTVSICTSRMFLCESNMYAYCIISVHVHSWTPKMTCELLFFSAFQNNNNYFFLVYETKAIWLKLGTDCLLF